MIKCFDYHCQGESHKAIDKVCQDYTYSAVNGGYGIAIVCDGHGGKRYFRSDVGARLATEITANSLDVFVHNVDAGLFIGKPYTDAEAITTEIKNDDTRKFTQEDKALRQLFGSILSQWHNAIEEHAASTPITDNEHHAVEQQYLDEFAKGGSLEKIYGCTLMVYVRTNRWWLAFHLGDGKCISIDKNGDWKEPIPWDERCFLNKTTSICDSNAINEFRYCYCGDGSFPVAVFLGSDGMDDSFGEELNLANFYYQVAKSIAKDGHDAVVKDVRETLPVLSKRGSQDDMSLACIYDERISDLLPALIEWQLEYNKAKIHTINARIQQADDRKNQIPYKGLSGEKRDIELFYANQDIAKGYEQKAALVKTMNKLLVELNGDQAPRYRDELGNTVQCLHCAMRDKCMKNG